MKKLERNANRSNRALARNAGLSFLSFLASSLTALIATPLLLRHLGEQSYGLWMFLVGLVSYAGLAELGIGAATIRAVASAQATESTAQLASVMRNSRAIMRCAATICLVAFCIVVWQLYRLDSIPESRIIESQVTVVLLAIAQSTNFAIGPYIASLIGRGRSDLVIGPGATVTLLTLSLQVVVSIFYDSPIALAAVALAGSLASLIATRLIHSRLVGPSREAFAPRRDKMLWDLIGLGRQNAVINFCWTISYGGDVLLIGLLLPIEQVAAYGIATRLPLAIKSLATRVNDVLVPRFADAQALGETERLRVTFQRSLLTSLAIASVPGALCISMPDAVLRSWLHTEPPNGSALILTLLSVALLLQLPANMTYSMLSGIGELTRLMRLSIAQAIANVTLSISFTLWLGVEGPAIGTLAEVAILGSLVPLLSLRHLGFSGLTFKDAMQGLLHMRTPVLLICLTEFIGQIYEPNGLLGLSLVAICLLLMQGFLLYLFDRQIMTMITTTLVRIPTRKKR